jgi:hypothetical protein
MTDGDGQRCLLTVDEAIKVAFDQILSRIAFGEASSDLLASYLSERNVRQRLASARSVIFDALERVIGQEVSDRIGEEGYRHFD